MRSRNALRRHSLEQSHNSSGNGFTLTWNSEEKPKLCEKNSNADYKDVVQILYMDLLIDSRQSKCVLSTTSLARWYNFERNVAWSAVSSSAAVAAVAHWRCSVLSGMRSWVRFLPVLASCIFRPIFELLSSHLWHTLRRKGGSHNHLPLPVDLKLEKCLGNVLYSRCEKVKSLL